MQVKQGQATREEAGEYKDIACVCRNRVRKTKAELELKWATEMDNTKSFSKCLGSKRKAKEIMGQLLSQAEDLMGKD